MGEGGRCARPREIPRHHPFKSHHEAAREDPGCVGNLFNIVKIEVNSGFSRLNKVHKTIKLSIVLYLFDILCFI